MKPLKYAALLILALSLASCGFEGKACTILPDGNRACISSERPFQN